MPGYSAGSIFLQVVPSFRGAEREIAEAGRELANEISGSFDDQFEKNVSQGIPKAVEKAAKQTKTASAKAGKEAGEEYSGRFQESLKRGIAGAQKEVDRLKINLDDKDARKKLTELQVGLKGLNARIGVDIDSGKAMIKFAELEQKARDLHDNATSLEFRANIGSAIRGMETLRAEIESLSSLDIEPNLKVDRQLGLFEKAIKQGMKNALDSLPPIELDDSHATAQVAELRERLLELSDVEIGVELDSDVAFRELIRVEEELRAIADGAMDMKLRVDAAGALAVVASVRGELEALSRLTVEPNVDIQVDRDLGNFDRALRGAIEGAIKEIGPIDLPIDARFDDVGQRAVRQIRADLLSLQDNVINMRLSDETAIAEIYFLRDQLEQIAQEGWSARVDADTAAAKAQLDALLVALDRLDGDTTRIDIDVDGAASALAVLRAAEAEQRKLDGATAGVGHSSDSAANSFRAFNGVLFGLTTIGPAVVPLLAGIGGGLLALGPLAAVGAAGLGTFALALSGVGGAVKAMNQASATGVTQQQTYTKAVQSSAASVRDAEQGVARARQDAARSAEDSEKAVQSALRGVQDAEKGVADAQRDRQQAQEDLNRAIKDAVEQQEDLALSLRGSQLDEVEAGLRLREAQKALQEGIAGGATGDDLLELQTRVERYQLSLDQAKERTGDLSEETQNFAKNGVDASEQVQSARQRLADADQKIADAQQRVADAQSAVADARLNQQRSAQDATRATQDAQERLNDAQLRYVEALDNVNSAQNKVNQSMKNLSPAGREFATFLFGLKDDLQGLRYVAQEGFLPGLQSWMQTITGTYGPQLQRTVFNLSSALGDMFAQFGSALLSKPFADLFSMIENDGPRFIGYMGDVLTNLGKGTASLIVAMEPLADLFGEWFVRASRMFADWAAGLQGSNGLRDFFDYMRRIGPEIGDFIMALGGAVVNLAKALAPYGEVLLGILTDVARWIADMDTDKLSAIVVGIITMIGAMQVIFGVTAGLKSIAEAWRAFGAVGEALGSKWAGFLGSAVLLGGALFILYQNSEDFRTAVDALWNNVLKPIGEFLLSLLIPALEGLTDIIKDHPALIAAVAAAFAGWKIISTVTGWVKGLRVESEALATTLNKKYAGAAVGGGLGILGALGFGFTVDQVNQNASDTYGDPIQRMFADLRKGGDAGARAREALQKPNGGQDFNWTDTVESWLPGSSALEEYNAASAAYRQQWKDMTALQQAQSKVAEWTQTLSDRQRSGTATADELSAAQRRLDFWTGQVTVEQQALVEASTGVNASLLEQQGLAIALADADIAYSQSMNALDQAFNNYKNTMNDVNASEEERRQAEEQWTNQSRATADAAAAVAAARHQNAEASVRESYQNAALLLDLERQKEVYGELPPRLEELRQSLESSVDPAYKVATQMENLGIKVTEIPGSKSVDVSSNTPEQIQALDDLGFRIETLPDGTITATAETQGAEDALNLAARDRTSTIFQSVRLDTAASQTGDYVAKPGVVVKKARGGPVWGAGTATSDSIAAWLSNGEYVIKAAAVQKYGLDFFHQVNGMAFANGGLVAPGYAGGGMVANWGGTIDISGGDVSPLAQFFVIAVQQVQQLSQQAADLVSYGFTQMRDRAVGSMYQMQAGVLGVLGQLTTGMVQVVGTGNRNVVQNFATAGAYITTVETNLMAQLLQIVGTGNRNIVQNYSTAGAYIQQVMTATAQGVNTTWVNMSMGLINATTKTMDMVGAQFGRLRTLTGDPVNFVINAVLNNGLFKALNSVSTTFGLNQNVPAAAPVQLAMGGRVGGFSPSKTADNIPAMLTAGEWVLPVDAVNYYGPELLEMLRRRQLPRDIFPHLALGGPATWPQLNALRARLFPNSVMTSGYRPGSADYHGAGQAVDIGVAGNVPAQLIPIAQALSRMYPQSAEIINNPGASIKNGSPVPPSFWGASTWAQHANHVHWAMTAAQLAMGANPAGYVPGVLGAPAIDPESVLRDLQNSVAQPLKDMVKQFGDSPFVRMLGDVPGKLIDGVWGKIKDRVTEALTLTAAGSMDGSLAGVATTGPIQDIVRSVANQFGWGAGAQWDALSWIIQRESGWRPTAQNPTSTAYGLFQFLNGTWAGTGIAKTADPAQQALAGLRYIKGRYTDPIGAQRFWQANGWYSKGGEVQPGGNGDGPVTPELMDTGGWIHPGLNVIMNKTGRPEPVINPATLDALISIANSGAGSAPTIGQYTQNLISNSPREAAEETVHQVRVLQRGGRYNPVGGRV